ncbi:hypothetical protein AB0D08_40795 [Kitasatospora sp. NPDC048540]|uniref:hypothetical protein n=1 Tax=unclassified Kitasatospora TaxID=2633591 RepID=UPI00053B229F|nr:hypothetical protein [Kitasatospora sp. MBT63]
MVRPLSLPAPNAGTGLIPAPDLDLPSDHPGANLLPVIPPGEDLAAALMHSAASRPVEEVADLLLQLEPDRTPTLTPALHRALAGRPVEELVRLLTLLRPRDRDGADAILRTAVLTRPPDEVAGLTVLLAAEPDSGIRDALCAAAALRPVADVAHLAQLLQPVPEVVRPAGPVQLPEPSALSAPDATAPAPYAELPDGSADGRAPEQMAAPRPAVRVRGRRTRSQLRWPAAGALLATGALHLPLVLPHWGQNPVADAVFTAVAALCLLLAVLLVLRDAPWVWIAGAAVGGSAITGYLISGSLAFPDLAADLTQWQSYLVPAALACEAALVALALTHAATRRRRRPTGGPAAPVI